MFAKRLGFDFKNYATEKVGVLHKYVKDHKKASFIDKSH
jgi:hypothetical protein